MKIAIATSEAPQARGPYSQAISAGDYLFVAGQIPIDPKTGQLIEGEIEALTIRVLDNIEAILKAAGLSLKHVVKTKRLKRFQQNESSLCNPLLRTSARPRHDPSRKITAGLPDRNILHRLQTLRLSKNFP